MLIKDVKGNELLDLFKVEESKADSDLMHMQRPWYFYG